MSTQLILGSQVPSIQHTSCQYNRPRLLANLQPVRDSFSGRISKYHDYLIVSDMSTSFTDRVHVEQYRK